MRILHVNAAYPPFLGGAEVYTQAISERLVRDGHAVTLVTTNAAEVEYFWNPRKRHVSPGREQLNGVQVIRCQVGHLPFSPWSFYLLRRVMTIIARWPVNVLPLLRRLASFMPSVPEIQPTLAALPGHFDLVHGVNIALERPLLAAWCYARRHQIPFVATPFVHIGERGRHDVLGNYVMPHQLEPLRGADAVIVQTDIEKKVLAQLGVAEERLHILGVGIDLNEIRGGEAHRFRTCHGLDGSIVTFLGVVTRDKGSFHLVRAMERLWAQGRHVHLVIAGPLVDEFVHFYKRLSPATRERILLLGPVPDRDKQNLLAATDIFVLPSRIDSFGIVFLEAWAYGKPVIGGKAGGIPAVIDDGVDGLLVPFGNPEALATTITHLLDNPALARAMGERGRQKVITRYTWEHQYTSLKTLYRRLVEERAT